MRSNREITPDSLQDFYGALAVSAESVKVEEIDWREFVDPSELMDDPTPPLSEFIDLRDFYERP